MTPINIAIIVIMSLIVFMLILKTLYFVAVVFMFVFFIAYMWKAIKEKFAFMDRPLQNKTHYENMSRTLGGWGKPEPEFCYDTQRDEQGQCEAGSLACGSMKSWDSYIKCAETQN